MCASSENPGRIYRDITNDAVLFRQPNLTPIIPVPRDAYDVTDCVKYYIAD